ncbi:hypothetical protein GF374_02350 [Candidatus Woesearchaeota archaeon]|nr:hypothetical protein [Candidatus Woesearchaeota archaeon]
MAEDKLTFAAIILVAIVAIIGMIGIMGYGELPQITGAGTTPSGTAKINISGLGCLALDDENVSLGTGSVTAEKIAALAVSNGTTVNGSWSADDAFNLRNCGNYDLNVTIETDDKDLGMTGTAVTPTSYFQPYDDAAPGEAGSCVTWVATEDQLTEFSGDATTQGFCENFTYGSGDDELGIDIGIKVPYDEPAGWRSAIITFTGEAAT